MNESIANLFNRINKQSYRQDGGIPAKYPGWCCACDDEIIEDDMITKDYDTGRYIHYDCQLDA